MRTFRCDYRFWEAASWWRPPPLVPRALLFAQREEEKPPYSGMHWWKTTGRSLFDIYTVFFVQKRNKNNSMNAPLFLWSIRWRVLVQDRNHFRPMIWCVHRALCSIEDEGRNRRPIGAEGLDLNPTCSFAFILFHWGMNRRQSIQTLYWCKSTTFNCTYIVLQVNVMINLLHYD